jgi:hypothetical protein
MRPAPITCHFLMTQCFLQIKNAKIETMEEHIFCILIDHRGHHRKGVAIYNATQVNLQQKPWFL